MIENTAVLSEAPKTNHAEVAQAYLDSATEALTEKHDTVAPDIATAQVHATLALAAEVRRSNILTYAATLPPSLLKVRDNLIDAVGRELLLGVQP